MLITIICLSALLIGCSLVIFNLLRKVEALEEYVSDLEQSNLDYYTFYTNLKSKTSEAYSRMKNIDRLGSFESDDETGYVFKELKDIVGQLNGDFE
jgi:hypothetical protein